MRKQPQREEESMFQEGDIIGKTYRVVKRLGRGGYGEIFACVSSAGDRVAIKVERTCRTGNLQEEEAILQVLKHSKYVPHLKQSCINQENSKINYIVMELFGENLSNIRRKQQGYLFSLPSTIMLARQMLRCIREVHEAGILHRDIKPGNFVLGTRQSKNPRTIIIIDYGLSKQHLENGQPKPKKPTARWVGSRRYMSLNTHFRKDQGRRDDLWSLIYVLIEFRTGTLPWAHLRGVENFDKIRDTKIQYANSPQLYTSFPPDFLKIVSYLQTLHYESTPDYS